MEIVGQTNVSARQTYRALSPSPNFSLYSNEYLIFYATLVSIQVCVCVCVRV